MWLGTSQVCPGWLIIGPHAYIAFLEKRRDLKSSTHYEPSTLHIPQFFFSVNHMLDIKDPSLGQ